jgi:hypothetical protein
VESPCVDGYRAVRGWEIRNWKPAPGTFPLQEVERGERCSGGDLVFAPSQFAHLAITYSGLIVNDRDDGDPLLLRRGEQQEYTEAKRAMPYTDATRPNALDGCQEQGQEARGRKRCITCWTLPDESEHS